MKAIFTKDNAKYFAWYTAVLMCSMFATPVGYIMHLFKKDKGQ